MIPAYAKVLPGLQGNASDVAGGEHFAIGSEKQFAAYEEYPKKAEGPAMRLWRVPSGFLADGPKARVKNAGRAYFFAFAPTG
jgi:hypothetical protein